MGYYNKNLLLFIKVNRKRECVVRTRQMKEISAKSSTCLYWLRGNQGQKIIYIYQFESLFKQNKKKTISTTIDSYQCNRKTIFVRL